MSIKDALCCDLTVPLCFPQLTPLPSCTAVSAGSFWREPFTPSSSHRVTQKLANARTPLGKAGLPALFLTVWCELVIYPGSVLFFWSVSLSGSFPVPWSSSSCWTAVQRTLLPLLLPSRLLPVTPPPQVWIAQREQPCPIRVKHESHRMFACGWDFFSSLFMINQIAIRVITVNMNGFSLLHLQHPENQSGFWD